MKLVLKERTGTPPIFQYDLLNEDVIIGRLELYPTPKKEELYPEGFESHFYYEIKPEYRGNGYGTEILKLGLREAKNVGLRRVVIACTDENPAAQKTIQENRALFLDSKPLADGHRVFKYTVDFS